MTERESDSTPSPSLETEAAEKWSDDFDVDATSLAEVVNRLLDKGVVIAGEVTISVAGIDLVYLGLNAVLTSVSTAREQLGRLRLPTSE